MSESKSTFIYDLITHVLEFCRDDWQVLFQSSLVNWEFNRAASRILYSRVAVSPRFSLVLNLRDPSSIPETSNLHSATLPQNASSVVSLEISGFISLRPPPRNTLPEIIANAIPLFVNLGCVIFTPLTFHEDLFARTLCLLPNLRYLTDLTVNQSCTSDARAQEIVQVNSLKKLTLFNPGRAILQLLPDWLHRLSPTLAQLHLKGNCGSVTPGVLRSFVPHVGDSLEAFTLGLSYSLTDDDVFTFLGGLPKLKTLHLRYYWQMKPPRHQPDLTSLYSLTATYSNMGTRREVDDFGKWIRRAITGSPNIQKLCLLTDPSDAASCNLSYDGVIDHLVKKHSATLKVLDMASSLVAVDKLKELLTTCLALEELVIKVDRSALFTFAQYSGGLSCLRYASFRLANVKPSHRTDEGLITTIMRSGPPSLRRISVNEITWERSWIVNSEHGTTELDIRRIEKLPWVGKSNK